MMIGDDWYLMAVWQYCIFIVWPQASFKISASEGHGANASEGPIGCHAGKPWGSQNAGGRCGYPAGDGERSESNMLLLVLEVQIYVFVLIGFACFALWPCHTSPQSKQMYKELYQRPHGGEEKKEPLELLVWSSEFPLLSLGARPKILPVGHCLFSIFSLPCSCQAPVAQMDSHIWICGVQ